MAQQSLLGRLWSALDPFSAESQPLDPQGHARFYSTAPEHAWPTVDDWQQAGLRTCKPVDIRLPNSTQPKLPLLHKHVRKGGYGMSMPGKSILPAVMNILAPPVVFGVIFTTMCFSLHYRYPRGVWCVGLLGVIPVFVALSSMRKALQVPGADTRWHKLSITLFLVAVVVSLFAGELIYWFFFHTYYQITSMKTYSNISPAEATGQRLMDAGRVHFAEDARLATEMGMSFTNWDTYCVAPITVAGEELASYDLWAVGVNCCRSADPVFSCGEYHNPTARSGLRQVSEEHRLFFRLAIQQAESAYDIQANHPIFFYWVQDPTKDIDNFFVTGFKHWMMGLMLHFCLNTAFVAFFYMSFRPNRAPANLHTLGQ